MRLINLSFVSRFCSPIRKISSNSGAGVRNMGLEPVLLRYESGILTTQPLAEKKFVTSSLL